MPVCSRKRSITGNAQISFRIYQTLEAVSLRIFPLIRITDPAHLCQIKRFRYRIIGPFCTGTFQIRNVILIPCRDPEITYPKIILFSFRADADLTCFYAFIIPDLNLLIFDVANKKYVQGVKA